MGKESQDKGRLAQVAIVVNDDSTVTKRHVNLAHYLSICMSHGGWCEKVYLVSTQSNPTKSNLLKARRRDGAVLAADSVQYTSDMSVIKECDAIFLCVDVLQLNTISNLVSKALVKGPKSKNCHNIIVHLETSLKRADGFDKAYFPDKTVLQGGACFDVIVDSENILTPLSNGSMFIERLSKEKESALFCLDIINSCAMEIISRRNLRAIHWSNAMITSIYAICALTNLPVTKALEDRRCRLIYADMIHEIQSVLNRVSKDKHWTLDQSAHCFLPIPSILSLLPLPSLVFSILTKVFEFGVTNHGTTDIALMTTDLAEGLSTEIGYEYDDVLELASRYDVKLNTITQIQTLLIETAKKKTGSPKISPAVLYATIKPSSASRQHSTWFVLKLFITIISTIGLIYMLR